MLFTLYMWNPECYGGVTISEGYDEQSKIRDTRQDTGHPVPNQEVKVLWAERASNPPPLRVMGW
jgi:hypothetical protein